jgi:hypothetical protein
MVFTAKKLNSLVSVQPPVNAIPSQRLTVWPCASFSTNVSLVQDVMFEGGALGAKGPAVDRMVRVTLDVDYLRRDVLCLVAQGIDDHAAAHRAVGTRGPRLGGSCYF